MDWSRPGHPRSTRGAHARHGAIFLWLRTNGDLQARAQRTAARAASVVNGVDALQAYFAGYLPQLMLACVVPLAVLAAVATIDPVSAGILAVTIPVLVGFMILIGKGTRPGTR